MCYFSPIIKQIKKVPPFWLTSLLTVAYFSAPLCSKTSQQEFSVQGLSGCPLLLTPSPVIPGKLLLWRFLSPLHFLFSLPEMYFPRYLRGLTIETQWGLLWPLVSVPESPNLLCFSLRILSYVYVFIFFAYCLVPFTRLWSPEGQGFFTVYFTDAGRTVTSTK